jgi:predicted amino acid dehydrogenase
MKTAEIVRSGHVAQEAARRQTILKSERTDREDFWMKRAFELTRYRAKKDRETKTWSDAQLMLRWARENAEVQSSYGQSFQYQDEVRVRMTVGKALRGTIVTCSTTRDAYVVAYENGDVQWFVPADRIRKERP